MYSFNPSSGLKSFLSPRACSLLIDSFRANLRSASLLATGTATALPADGLFGMLRRESELLVAAEDERRQRMIYYASQAWNLNFFLSSLVSNHQSPTMCKFSYLSVSRRTLALNPLHRSWTRLLATLAPCPASNAFSNPTPIPSWETAGAGSSTTAPLIGWC